MDAATDSTGWDEQACSHNTFHDINVTSRLAKNIYLMNQILSKHFEFLFVQLQLWKF